MSLRSIYQRQLDVARREESVRDAAERMHQRLVGCLVVVDEHQRPVGMLTDRDLAVRVVAEGRDNFTTQVSEVMSEPVTSVDEQCEPEHALAAMRSATVRRLPVVDRNGKLIGIVALDDIFRHLAQQITKAGQLLERESPTAAAIL